VDSAGLKIFGEGGWLEEKHKATAKRKTWQKTHHLLKYRSSDLGAVDVRDSQIT